MSWKDILKYDDGESGLDIEVTARLEVAEGEETKYDVYVSKENGTTPADRARKWKADWKTTNPEQMQNELEAFLLEEHAVEPLDINYKYLTWIYSEDIKDDEGMPLEEGSQQPSLVAAINHLKSKQQSN
tara:strand:+ start:484 stop:870 length:387 start_codon:yes stop_codon:yes gene_type:complete